MQGNSRWESAQDNWPCVPDGGLGTPANEAQRTLETARQGPVTIWDGDPSKTASVFSLLIRGRIGHSLMSWVRSQGLHDLWPIVLSIRGKKQRSVRAPRTITFHFSDDLTPKSP